MGWINSAQFGRDHNGQRNTCAACGHDATTTNPLVLGDDGYRIHDSHTREAASGFYGAEQGSGARQQTTDDIDGQ